MVLCGGDMEMERGDTQNCMGVIGDVMLCHRGVSVI